jgi:hypothetical protein
MGISCVIELLSLSADNKSTDRKNSLNAFNELTKIDPTGIYSLILIDSSLEDVLNIQ